MHASSPELERTRFDIPLLLGHHNHFAERTRVYKDLEGLRADKFNPGEALYEMAKQLLMQQPRVPEFIIGKRESDTSDITADLSDIRAANSGFYGLLIDTKDQPSVGPANARVTIVEYADLECPTCAYFQKFLESEFLPHYGSKVRIVFKEFPISSHPWSATAAVANECAFQIDPSKFLNYRTLIFGNQETITVTNLRAQLLSLGEQAGLDRVNLSSCLDSKASLGRIEACRKEALALGVDRTPTFFVNGRIVIGVPPAPAFYAIVDAAMASADARN